jgi:hypothetical protein
MGSPRGAKALGAAVAPGPVEGRPGGRLGRRIRAVRWPPARAACCCVTAAVALATPALACSSLAGDRAERPPVSAKQLAAARAFDKFPLYWVGRRFEGWNLVHIDLVNNSFVLLVYGTCTTSSSEGGCSPPLQLQIRRLCDHLVLPGSDRVRGAPIGEEDNAPVLLTQRVCRSRSTGDKAPTRAHRCAPSAH